MKEGQSPPALPLPNNLDDPNTYIPALRFNILTSLYDPLMRLAMQEAAFKRQLIRQAQIQSGQRMLDLGCGTATLMILIKQIHPEAEVFGLDGDLKVLAIARAKATKAGTKIAFEQGMAFNLPYPDESFDRVFSSLVFHHLTMENKQRTFAEVYRVLRPGGEIHLADFGRPRTAWARLASLVMVRLEEASDNFWGRLPYMMQSSGFTQVGETESFGTLFGTLTLFRAIKPG